MRARTECFARAGWRRTNLHSFSLVSAHSLGFDEKQKSYVTLNLGAGYTTMDGALRIEGYVANLLDEDATTKAQFAPGLNLRFLNDPRTMGLRLRYRF